MKIQKLFINMVALFALILLGGCNSESGNMSVPVIQNLPLQATNLNSITVSGVVESDKSRNVYSTLSFMIDSVHVSVGDNVEEGQVLAQLDTADLSLSITQQREALALARQNSQNAVSDNRRLLSEAESNLANNTNVHIVNAEGTLRAAQVSLEAAQINYDDALRDHNDGINPQVISAASLLRTAKIELDIAETNHINTSVLHAAGALSSEVMSQSENTLTHARNKYNDAQISYDNVQEQVQRTLEQLRIIIQSAITARNSAEEVLKASRVAAGQDIERLRSQVTSAETAANLAHMETALQQLERQLSDATIRSPINGTVTSVIAKEGAVGAGLMFTVEDTSNLKIKTSFREHDLTRLASGMSVSITADGTGDAEYTGIISKINPSAIPSSSIVEFEAEVAVTSVDTSLRIGMNARLNIVLE